MWRALVRGYRGRAAAAARWRLVSRCWRRCRTRFWRSGSSYSPTACCEHNRGLAARRQQSGWESRPPATWFLRVISDRTQRRFRERVTVALESHVARLQASVVSIEHHERPEFLDRLAMLRDQVFVLDHMYMSLFSTCGWILRLGVTLVLLVSIHPALALLALFALPTVLTSDLATGRRACCRRSGGAGESAGAASVLDLRRPRRRARRCG